MSSRRDFLKRAGYAAPVILTLSARPSFAGTGSKRPGGDDNPDAHHRRRRRRRKRRRRIIDWLRDILRR